MLKRDENRRFLKEANRKQTKKRMMDSAGLENSYLCRKYLNKTESLCRRIKDNQNWI